MSGTVVIPGQPPVGAGPGIPPQTPVKKGSEYSKSKAFRLAGVTVGVVLLISLAVAAVTWFIRSSTGGSRLLLAFPERSGEYDLYLLRLKQSQDEGTLIAEDVRNTTGYFSIRDADKHFISIGNYDYGGFVPETDSLLFWYQGSDGDIFLEKMGVNGDQPTSLFDSNSEYLVGRALGGGRDVFVIEPRDDQERCYFSQSDAEADRVAKGDECSLSVDGSTVFVVDWDGDKFSLDAMDVDGDNEIKLLDEQESILSWKASPDGSRIAYLSEGEDVKLVMLDRKSGEVIVEGEVLFNIVDFGFARQGQNLYYIGENDAGELQLFTLDESGSNLVASGVTFNAIFSPDGNHLAYLLGDEDGEETLYVHSMAGGDIEIAKGENLQFGLMSSPAQFILLDHEADELTLSSMNADGSSLVQIYKEEDVYLDWVFYIPGEEHLYLMLRDNDELYSLFAAFVGQEDGFMLIEEWASLQVLNCSSNGKHLVFVGQEDYRDDPVLYSIEVKADSKPVELDDDADGYSNAVFTPSGTEVIYTSVTGYDKDDVEVRSVPVDGEERYERLYDEAFLVDVQWGQMDPFNGIYFYETMSGTSFCPGARTLALDNTLEAELVAGEEICYHFRADADQVYTISVVSVSAMEHPGFSVYDREGNYLDGSSWGEPLIVNLDHTGTYFLLVEGYYSSDSDSYSVTVYEGLSDPAFSQAILLTAGALTRGAITSTSNLYLETYDYATYGTMYAFNGQASDQVTIDVFADSIGSSLDPVVYLFDSLQELLYEDDDGGSGYDSRIAFSLPDSGRYYLLVEDAGESYGSADDYFYDILLTLP